MKPAGLCPDVRDGGDDLDTEAAHPRHHFGQVRGQVVVMIAEVDHGRGDARQRGQEGPVDGALRAHRDDVAMLEDVAVDGDYMGHVPGFHLGFERRQQLAGPLAAHLRRAGFEALLTPKTPPAGRSAASLGFAPGQEPSG